MFQEKCIQRSKLSLTWYGQTGKKKNWLAKLLLDTLKLKALYDISSLNLLRRKNWDSTYAYKAKTTKQCTCNLGLTGGLHACVQNLDPQNPYLVAV